MVVIKDYVYRDINDINQSKFCVYARKYGWHTKGCINGICVLVNKKSNRSLILADETYSDYQAKLLDALYFLADELNIKPSTLFDEIAITNIENF